MSGGMIGWAGTDLPPSFLQLDGVLIVAKAFNNDSITVIFAAQVCEALVSAGTELLDVLEDKFPAFFNVWVISGIPWLTTEMLAAFYVINK